MQRSETKTCTALVIGEALIDIVVRDGEPSEHVGGSPTNTAVGVARLGHRVRMLSNIGRDARGHRIAALLAREEVELLAESWVDQPTSTAQATIGADGSAAYAFDLSWSLPARNSAASRDADPVALVHAGSIALFLEPGGAEVLQQLRRAHSHRMVTLDPNIRASLLPDHGVALRRFEEAAALANLVKLSDEDALWLYPESSLEAVAEHIRGLGVDVVVVTLGASGALAAAAAGIVRVVAPEVSVSDTIGAGDSFMASLIGSLLESDADLAEFDVAWAVTRATNAAAIAVSRPGANPPTRSELRTFLR